MKELEELDRPRWGTYELRCCQLDVEREGEMSHGEEGERQETFKLAEDLPSSQGWTGLQGGVNTITRSDDSLWLALGNFQLNTGERPGDTTNAWGMLNVPGLEPEEMAEGQPGSLLLLFQTSSPDWSRGRFILDENVTVSSSAFDQVLTEGKKPVEAVDFNLRVGSAIMDGGEQDLTATFLPRVQHYLPGLDRSMDFNPDQWDSVKGLYDPLPADPEGRIPVTEVEDDHVVRELWDVNGRREPRSISSESKETSSKGESSPRVFFDIQLCYEKLWLEILTEHLTRGLMRPHC